MEAKLLKTSALSMAEARKRQRAAGFYETTVFVHERVRDAIDRAIAEGLFKSRREAMEHAISSVFHAEEGATKPR